MLYFVFLRRPSGLSDRRDDPFWEFGSFGRTGCHRSNLMHPMRTPLRDGDRLAFLQGGRGAIRMTGLTPPIKIMPTAEGIEARWDKNFRPFSFADSPTFIDNEGNSDFPGVSSELDGTLRSTNCGKAASRFRSRTRPIEERLAARVIKYFTRWKGSHAKLYLDAVEADHERWHQEGVSKGWAAKSARESVFLARGGIPTKAERVVRKPCHSSTNASASIGRKRRCG